MSAIPIYRINDLEFRAEWTNRDFISFHINYWHTDYCYTIALIKGVSTVDYLVDRAFDPRIDPHDLHHILQQAFTFISAIPQPTTVIYHLEQLYPEYFI